MHTEALEFATKVAYEHGPWSRVVEAGSLNINGGVRHLFPDALFTGVDRSAGRGVDVVSDFSCYRIPELGEHADLIVCCEVLEHTPDRAGILEAAHACLKPHGLLLITCATDPREPHGCGGGEVGSEWYGNVDPNLLTTLSADAGFTTLEFEVHVDRGDLYALAQRGD